MKIDIPSTDALDDDFVYIDPILEFDDIIKFFIIEPFGEKLNSDLLEIFSDLDLSITLVAELKKLNKRTPRRNMRKPCTPSKLMKEEVKGSSQSRSASKAQDQKNSCDSST